MSVVEQTEPVPVPRRAGRARLVFAGAFALLGVVITMAVLLLTGWRYVPVHRYEVAVHFEKAATPEHWDAVRADLDGLPHDEDVRVRTEEEALARLTEIYAADGDPVPDSVTRESVPRSLLLVTSGRSFDCEPFAGLKKSPGVADLVVAEFSGDGRLQSVFEC
ncbi:hypothetical protein Q0Z83_055860 [Actinoplanes sichuanensis]|uniref:Permease-like cell division protein FtsX n=1 Tax=Actinoplanes sichuanensis TaxID=512349 RepID=A0ABW4AQL2_9ACTN|nr:permease-like cell division protein FtsX [Actinoplanes sichuanensis]BEL07395.1 hypothetical protein Q0Z83_055860 [Actinoplanes sichuanensis]